MRLSQLSNIYASRPAAVLGGGETLREDVSKLSRDTVLIAVNYHAHWIGLKPHFMVYLDDPRDRPQMMHILQHEKVVKVSPEFGSDVEMDVPYWRGNNSATTAAWLGLWMGCNPVYLCGMDLYTREKKYCHDDYKPEQVPTMNTQDLMRPWVEECRNLCPHPERLVAISGPLRSLFFLHE